MSDIVFFYDGTKPSVRFTLKETVATEDGKLSPRGVDHYLVDQPIVAEICDDGSVTMIRGFASVQNQAKHQLSENLYAQLGPYLSPEILAKRFANEWNSRVFLARHHDLAVGATWEVTRNLTIGPNVTRLAYSIFVVDKQLPKNRVLVWAYESTDYFEVISAVGKRFPALQNKWKNDESYTRSEDNWTQQIRYEIEMSTGLVVDEKSMRVISTCLKEGGQEVLSKITERKDRSLIDVVPN